MSKKNYDQIRKDNIIELELDNSELKTRVIELESEVKSLTREIDFYNKAYDKIIERMYVSRTADALLKRLKR